MTKLEQLFQNSKEKRFVLAAHLLFNNSVGFSVDEIAEMLFALAMHIKLLISFDDVEKYTEAINVEFWQGIEACADQYLKIINKIQSV
jgi:hypothetical protein